MRCLMIFALDPGPEPAIERVGRAQVRLAERRQELHPYRAEEAFLFPLAGGLIGASVDEGDAQPRAYQRQVMRAEDRAIVDVQAKRDTSTHPRPLEHRPKPCRVLPEREAGVRNG